MDDILDSDDEKVRVNNLGVTVFNDVTISMGSTSPIDLTLCCTNNSSLLSTPTKPDHVFWDVCPMADSSCVCISSTLAKELMDR